MWIVDLTFVSADGRNLQDSVAGRHGSIAENYHKNHQQNNHFWIKIIRKELWKIRFKMNNKIIIYFQFYFSNKQFLKQNMQIS